MVSMFARMPLRLLADKLRPASCPHMVRLMLYPAVSRIRLSHFLLSCPRACHDNLVLVEGSVLCYPYVFANTVLLDCAYTEQGKYPQV